MKPNLLLGIILSAVILLPVNATTTFANTADRVDMHRVYNPNSGEHFYTQDSSEKDNLVQLGWKDEGIGWTAPTDATTTNVEPVYRLYNPNAGDHFFTTNINECSNLTANGWNFEGIGWYSSKNKEVPIYREYNPNATGAGSHNFTKDIQENNALVKAGWKSESIGWYGVASNSNNPFSDTNEELPVVVDQGWKAYPEQWNQVRISIGAKINNPNLSQNYYGDIGVVLYRADGSAIDSRRGSVLIPANTTIPFGFDFTSTRGEMPDHIKIKFHENNFSFYKPEVVNPNEYIISNMQENFSDINTLNVKGIVTNTSNSDVRDSALIVVYYENGKIVGGAGASFHGLGEITAHSSVNFDDTYTDVPDSANREYAVIQVSDLR